MFHLWLEHPERILKLAWIDSQIAGIGMASTSAEILLNYVAPNARLRGVSSSLLSAMEADLFKAGHTVLSLDSTQTAHRFYLSRGWQDAGPPVLDGGMQTYPMRKTIGRDG
jgi:GNAT superfamily N-acetyltransferase